MITSVVVNKDGTVLVFDEEGCRIPEYCGQWIRNREAIFRNAPYDAGFHGYDPARCSVCCEIIEGRFHQHMASEKHKKNVLTRGVDQHVAYISSVMKLGDR